MLPPRCEMVNAAAVWVWPFAPQGVGAWVCCRFNRCLVKVRRRVQNQTLGHRGHNADPLYRIRKMMLTGTERLKGPRP